MNEQQMYRVPTSERDINEVLEEVEEEIRLRVSGEVKEPYVSRPQKFRLKWGEDYQPKIIK